MLSAILSWLFPIQPTEMLNRKRRLRSLRNV